MAPSLPLTPWFDAVAWPERTGVYRRASPAGPYSCWAGGAWWGDAATPQAAAEARRTSDRQHVRWRGVAVAHGQPCRRCRGLGVVDPGLDDPAVETDRIDDCPDCP
jgi:hypothetical protein